MVVFNQSIEYIEWNWGVTDQIDVHWIARGLVKVEDDLSVYFNLKVSVRFGDFGYHISQHKSHAPEIKRLLLDNS